MEQFKISQQSEDSTDKKWVEVNDLSSGQYSANKDIR